MQNHLVAFWWWHLGKIAGGNLSVASFYWPTIYTNRRTHVLTLFSSLMVLLISATFPFNRLFARRTFRHLTLLMQSLPHCLLPSGVGVTTNVASGDATGGAADATGGASDATGGASDATGGGAADSKISSSTWAASVTGMSDAASFLFFFLLTEVHGARASRLS